MDSVATLKCMFTRMEKTHTDQINQLTNLVKELMDKVNGQTNKTADTQTVQSKDTVWGDKQGVSQVKSSLVAKRNDNNEKTKSRNKDCHFSLCSQFFPTIICWKCSRKGPKMT